jgi:hypothetical protein
MRAMVVRIFVTCFGAVCLLACGEETPATPELEPTQVHFELPLDTPAHRTGRLIGWNVGRGTLYGPAGDTIHPQWRTPEREQAFALLREIRPANGDRPVVRFSGLQIDGMFGGDGYHFWDFARPDRQVSATDNMAPWQWMAIVDEVDADPLVMLNFGSGTADEAARYVDHLVGTTSTPEAEARAHWGRVDPWPVHVYEIGNEIYGPWNTGYTAAGAYSYANPDARHGGDLEWHGRPASDPADYAARASAYVEAVSAVDPQARFWVPLSQASMDGWEGLDHALPALEPLLLDPRVEAVVVHHYQVGDAAVHGATRKDTPQLAMAGSDIFRPGYEELRRRLQLLPRETPLTIAVTEYHVAGAFTLGRFDERADTPLVGLGVADILITFAELGIEDAHQHMAIAFAGSADAEVLFESWYNPLRAVNGQVAPRPSYVATDLFASHMLRHTVLPRPLAMLDASYHDTAFSFDFPLVRAIAFVDDDGAASVVMLNRDHHAPHEITIDTPPGWVVGEAQAYAPTDWAAPGGDEPIELVPIELETAGSRTQLTIPPHALVGIGFRQQAE